MLEQVLRIKRRHGSQLHILLSVALIPACVIYKKNLALIGREVNMVTSDKKSWMRSIASDLTVASPDSFTLTNLM